MPIPHHQPVILADSDTSRRTCLATELRSSGYAVREYADAEAAFAAACASPGSAVVADLGLAGGAPTLMSAMRSDRRTAAARIVMIFDPNDHAPALRARCGAADFTLTRPVDGPTVAAALRTLAAENDVVSFDDDASEGDLAGFFEAAEARRDSENTLLAELTDPVTGLWNAEYTEIKLVDEFKRSRRFHTPLACVIFASDTPFPNTSRGRSDRRRLLRELSGVMLCESRDVDHLARLDDDRFIAILPHTDAVGAETMASRVANAVSKRAFSSNRRGAPATISAGLACSTIDEPCGTYEELLARATQALDASRRHGVGRVTTYAPPAVPAS
jgi:diguanylate cyclase (GGDEF)-like protein